MTTEPTYQLEVPYQTTTSLIGTCLRALSLSWLVVIFHLSTYWCYKEGQGKDDKLTLVCDHSFYWHYGLMATFPNPVLDQAFSFPTPPGILPYKIVKSLSELEFDSKGATSAFDHFYTFNQKCRLYRIANEHEGCWLFSLTFHGRIKS